MDWPTKCAAVIPCLNEAASIGLLVQGLRRVLPTVFVVDDGSSDQTGIIAQKAGAKVLRNELTTGKGAALARGWRYAYENGFRWALTLDGDGQHSPEDIHAIFACAAQTGASLVVGNRMSEAAEMPWVRRTVNRWMSSRISELTGQVMPDTQCGFRLLRLDLCAQLPIGAQHFEIESEVLLAFASAGLRVEFVPIRAIYKDEQSKIHPLRDTIRWLRWWRQVNRRDGKAQIQASISETTAKAGGIVCQ